MARKVKPKQKFYIVILSISEVSAKICSKLVLCVAILVAKACKY